MSARVRVSTPLEGVAQVLLDSGRHNFLSWELSEQLERELARLRDEGARVVVLGSAIDGVFAAHGDLDDLLDTFGGGTPSGDPMAFVRVQRELDAGPMVSIAAIDGQAWGGGAELAWACDLRVASTRTTFCQPEVLVGTTPAGGAARIARLAGEAAAKRIVLDGRPISAAEAFHAGLVHRLAPPGEKTLAAALDWAAWLAKRPPWALATNKAALAAARGVPLREALRAETAGFAEQLSKPEVLELVRGVKRRYDEGADSWDAFELPRTSPTPGA